MIMMSGYAPERCAGLYCMLRLGGAQSRKGATNAGEYAGELQFPDRRRDDATTVGATSRHQNMIEVACHDRDVAPVHRGTRFDERPTVDDYVVRKNCGLARLPPPR